MASARSLGALTVDLVAKVGGFTRGMTQAEREADKSAKAIERRLKKMGDGIEKGLAAAAAVAIAGLGALTVGVKKAIDAADELGKLSQRTGVSVEALSRLEVAASQSDTSLESLQKGIVNLGRAQLEARKGTEEQVALFRALGIGIQELEDMSPDVLLKRIADAFQATADSPEKAAVAMKLFGRAGAELIPLLNGGSEELERFERLSDELGNTISTETAQAAADFNDQLDLVKIGLGGVWRTAAQDLLPTLNELAADFNDPRFREGFSKLVTGAVEATVAVAGLISEIGNVTNFVGEELAARINGPAADDIVRLEQRADRLREELDNIVIDVPALLNPYGIGKRAELAAQIAEVEQQLKEARDWEARLARQAQPEPMAETPAAEEPAPGIDFDAWRKAVQEREAASEAAAAARRAEAVATREQAKADREAEAQARAFEAAQSALAGVLRAQAEEMGGPLAQAAFEYQDTMVQLAGVEEELIRLGKLDEEQQAKLALARERATQKYQDQTAAIQNQLSPMEELMASLDMELGLMRLGNVERATELELQRLIYEYRQKGIELTEDEIEANRRRIEAKFEEIEALDQQISALDDFRSSFEDNVAGVLDGSTSIKDAFRDLVDDLIAQLARLAAQKFTESLFGQQGTAGGGMFGDLFGSLFGAFTARASGGPVYPGQTVLVGEEGPELIRPMGAGTVIPAGQTAAMRAGSGRRGGDTFVIQGATSNRAIERIRMERDRADRKAQREFA